MSTNETNAVTSGGRATAPGYINSSKYRLRLVGYPEVLGAQSAVEWRGKRFTLDGDPLIYTGSTRTAHVDYRISRT
ncbi:hypothetical protein R4227_09355 [Gordonia amicalis]|uniref:Uncharacterized protein n=1 Tax=Gordonia amicalis TaxID=89053 RepID=A0ABU4DKK3_9ACTN|nr:hypothetical protein [Gordonia amicalis]MDV6310275.1 hypothetical protein [Gordonia amicalis]MDV7100336.1 hypothetical protein [Gordonia amicalis]